MTKDTLRRKERLAKKKALSQERAKNKANFHDLTQAAQKAPVARDEDNNANGFF